MYLRNELPNGRHSVVLRLTELLLTSERFGLRAISIGTLENLVTDRGRFDALGAAIKEKKLQLSEEGSFW